MKTSIVPKMMLILAAVMMVACSKDHPHVLQISGFELYVATFEQEAAQQGHQLSIDDLTIELKYNLIGQGYDGLCVTGDNSTPHIYLDQDHWNSFDDQGKHYVLEHEMGHCVLARQHVNDLRSDGSPVSMMYYSSIELDARWQYQGDEDFSYYVQELFANSPIFFAGLNSIGSGGMGMAQIRAASVTPSTSVDQAEDWIITPTPSPSASPSSAQ